MNDHRGQKPETLLITLTGKDRPGVTSTIFTTLSRSGVEVVEGPFDYPGGRRFHFRDPSGNQLGVFQPSDS